ncbi:hypothetical protein [Sulfuracidifex metallicus]|uniref:hypothetical protein n=1 Tax=Sulfuracidifex metallicus TaxID=47303 RepID=UPI0019D13994|nr:hypothetical protein [Sulfuracidifex metallicus]
MEELLTDVIRLSGVLGHFMVLMAYDRESGKLVHVGRVNDFPGKYLIGFIVPENEEIDVVKGYLEGPEIGQDYIEYRLVVNDHLGHIRFTMDSDEDTLLTVDVELPQELKVTFKDIDDMEEHIIKDHFFPYMEKFRNRSIYQTPFFTLKLNGKLKDVIEKVMSMGGKKLLKTRINENVVKIFIDDGKVDFCLIYGKKVAMGNEALKEVLETDNVIDATVYSIPVEEMVMIMI